MVKVGLDIGHGVDTYPPSKGVPSMPEFEFNNAVAKLAKPMLEEQGIEVVLGQPFDSKDVPLRQRTDKYNAEKVDIVMSIHADANANTSARGFWPFHWHTSSDGKRLAAIWADKLKSSQMRFRSIQASRPNHWTNFHILRETNMPAVLMEHGFMTNPSDLKLLKSDRYRREAAQAILETVLAYFGMDKKEDQPSKPSSETSDKTLYRVRDKWSGDFVQLGAYTVLDNAKRKADDNDGFNVYNEDGGVVYSKESTSQTPQPSEQSSRMLRYVQSEMMRGDDVKALQRDLNAKGFDVGSADGVFGPKTRDGVRAFQRAANITVDGIVGPQTREALENFRSVSLPSGVLREGDRGSNVTDVQKALNELNFNVGSADGIFGPRTKDGVLRFQKMFGVRPYDGIYGPKTKSALEARL